MRTAVKVILTLGAIAAAGVLMMGAAAHGVKVPDYGKAVR